MIIRNGNVVLKNSVEKKDILIENGKIVKIADKLPAGGEEIDASGLHVFPGLIDMHVHLREPGYEYKEEANVDIDVIMSKLYIYKTDLKNFLKQLQTCMLNSDVDGMEKAIKAREVMLKGANRAKTAHPGEFNNDEWYGGRELDYRFYNAKTIIKDIFESEGLIDVKSK